MRIGVNALYLIPGGVGGTEVYLRNLLASLAALNTDDEFVLFTNRETGTGLAPASSRVRTVVQPVHAVYRPARLLWEQSALPLALVEQRIDVLLNPGFTAPVLPPCPSVTVFHDLQHLRRPENFRWFDLPFWRLFLWAAAHRSDRLIAITQATRADLLSLYRLPPDRIDVVLQGVEDGFFRIARERGPRRTADPYLLCVSTLHPHKNLDRLVEAFAAFRRTHPHHRLVIAGMRGFHAAALEARIAALSLREHVTLTGWIERDTLTGLYRDADALLCPSTFEGFGLPVLEGLACGLPVACSSIPPHREVAAEAALLFPPESVDAIADAMAALTDDEPLRTRLAQAGPLRASSFSWRHTAEGTLASLYRAARRN